MADSDFTIQIYGDDGKPIKPDGAAPSSPVSPQPTPGTVPGTSTPPKASNNESSGGNTVDDMLAAVAPHLGPTANKAYKAYKAYKAFSGEAYQPAAAGGAGGNIPPVPPVTTPTGTPPAGGAVPAAGGTALDALGSVLGKFAGPLAAIAIALPIIAERTRRQRAEHDANRYEATTTPGAIYQGTIGSAARAEMDAGTKALGPVGGIVAGAILEPALEDVEKVTDSFARLVDIVYITGNALRDLALSVKPYEPTIAKALALQKVDLKLLEIERAQYLGPEAADTVNLQRELNREFSAFVNIVGRPSLRILNDIGDVLMSVISPAVTAAGNVLWAMLTVAETQVKFLKFAYDNSPAGKILNTLRDWKRNADKAKMKDFFKDQEDFFAGGQVQGFGPNNNGNAQPNNQGL